MIHPTAIVEEGAVIGANCEIHAYAVIKKHCVLGDRVTVHPFAVLGGDPQFLKFDPATPSLVKIGSGTVVREHVTVNRSIYAGKATSTGENCFLMATSHLAHDCEIGNNVVLANAVLCAGHVAVGDNAFLGGNTAIHQFARIGEGAMVGGSSRLSRDVPPFCLVSERDEISGLNIVGLKRRGFSRETIRELKDLYRAVYYTHGNIRKVAEELLMGGTVRSAEGTRFLQFFALGKRSFARPTRIANSDTETADDAS